MSGLEKQEIIDRTKSMTEDEMKIVVKLLPTNVLWDEMRRRDEIKTAMLQKIGDAVRMEVSNL